MFYAKVFQEENCHVLLPAELNGEKLITVLLANWHVDRPEILDYQLFRAMLHIC